MVSSNEQLAAVLLNRSATSPAPSCAFHAKKGRKVILEVTSIEIDLNGRLLFHVMAKRECVNDRRLCASGPVAGGPDAHMSCS